MNDNIANFTSVVMLTQNMHACHTHLESSRSTFYRAPLHYFISRYV